MTTATPEKAEPHLQGQLAQRLLVEAITDRVMESLENGDGAPWKKMWTGSDHAPLRVLSRNKTSPYNGINKLILGMLGSMKYPDPRYITAFNAKELGGYVKKGEKSMVVVFTKKQLRKNVANVESLTEEEKDKQSYFLYRYFRVFNVEQCGNLNLKPIEKDTPVHTFTPLEQAEKVISGMPNRPEIYYNGGNRNFYRPKPDTIHLVKPDQFHTTEEFYSTIFHEMGHSTGHKSRLNIEGITGFDHFGSDKYSKEELRAEFTASILCSHVGIENTIDNSEAYLRSWMGALNKDKTMLTKAAASADRAANYILGVK